MAELLGLITALTIQGIKFSEASTQIRGIFVKLLKPTKETKQFLAELGFESAEAAVKILGFTKFMELLIKRAKGSSTEIAKYINRIRGLSGVLAITGEGFTRLAQNIKEIEDPISSYERAISLVLNNTGKQLDIQLNQIKNFFVKDLAGEFLKDLHRVTFGFKSLTVAATAFGTALKGTVICTLCC
jgi:TP901 family phage tail tape measure protein